MHHGGALMAAMTWCVLAHIGHRGARGRWCVSIVVVNRVALAMVRSNVTVR